MNITRRNFLLYSGAAVLSANFLLPSKNIFGQTFNPKNVFPVPPESTNDAFNYLKREHFESVVNTLFEFQPDEGRIFNLKLIEIENLSLPANEEQGLWGESYSLLFEGSRKANIAQGVYRASHDLLGEFSLFIVPVGLNGNRCEAIINRINV